MSGSISKDFTRGRISTSLITFALSFMASNALLVLYTTIDMVIVGKFVGTEGLSAVSQSGQIITFATMLTLGFSNGGQVLISQAIGAGKRRELNGIIGTLFSFVAVFTVLLTAILLAFASHILKLIKMPAESFDMGKEYLIICLAGLIFTAGYNMVSAVLRGMGDAKRPFIFIGIASVVNLVLDLLFTGLWGWGVAGAAWATIIGQASSFIFSLFYLYRKRAEFGFDFKTRSFAIDKRYASMIIKLGTPMAIQSGLINISMLVVNAMINSVSVVASATFGVGVKIDDIVNKVSMSIQYAAMPMISQNVGAGRPDRAKKVVYFAWIYSAVFTVVFMTLYVLLGKQMFMLFSDDTAVHEMSEAFIKAILWLFPAFAIMRGSGAFIQGIGNAKLCMVLALLDAFVLRIGLSWLFGIVMGMGFYGFVLGYALAPYGYAIPSLLYFLFGKWNKKRTLADQI